MKKELFEFLKQLGLVFAYYLGDIIVRYISGKNEFPRYYWIAIGLVLAYQIIRDLKEIKDKIRDKEEKDIK